ncbi:MAG: MFS transporter [Rikenellaceae bacterium]
MVEKLRKTLADSAIARWGVLVAVSLTMMCGYFLTDAIAPLKSLLEKSVEDGGLGWTSTDFGQFNGGYGWLNVILLMMIVGGIILDKKGARFTGLFSIIIMFIGAVIKYYAIAYIAPTDDTIFGLKYQVAVAAVGYAIFAFGYETVNITATKLLVRWFHGKEMALALGMNVAFARLGTMLAMGAPLRIVEWTGSISAPILFGTVLLLLGVLTFLVVVLMDKKLDKQISLQPTTTGDDEKFRMNDILSIIKMRGFWFIAILCLVFYISIMTFQKYGVQFIGMKFSMSETSAGDLLMLLPVGALFLTPAFGGVYDKIGRGATMMILGCVLIIVVYALFSIPAITSTFAAISIVILLGIAFSLVPSAMWPSVAKIIPQQKLGTAYALIFWVQNIGLAGAPIAIGWILDAYCSLGANEQGDMQYDYQLPMLIFMGLGAVALVFGLLLKRENRIKGYGLEDPNM